jgi:hypothetical protein
VCGVSGEPVRDYTIPKMESGTGSGDRKRERGPLAQQKRQKVEPAVEEVPAYTYRVQRLGGDGINLTLAKPRVSGLELKQAIARGEGGGRVLSNVETV